MRKRRRWRRGLFAIWLFLSGLWICVAAWLLALMYFVLDNDAQADHASILGTPEDVINIVVVLFAPPLWLLATGAVIGWLLEYLRPPRETSTAPDED